MKKYKVEAFYNLSAFIILFIEYYRWDSLKFIEEFDHAGIGYSCNFLTVYQVITLTRRHQECRRGAPPHTAWDCSLAHCGPFSRKLKADGWSS